MLLKTRSSSRFAWPRVGEQFTGVISHFIRGPGFGTQVTPGRTFRPSEHQGIAASPQAGLNLLNISESPEPIEGVLIEPVDHFVLPIG